MVFRILILKYFVMFVKSFYKQKISIGFYETMMCLFCEKIMLAAILKNKT